jgi:ABC-type transport system involved in cytochrome bd biosynthesis fused ATPase/permease subunit
VIHLSVAAQGANPRLVDPNEEYSDTDIWAALNNCRLKAYVESLEGGLDAKVTEGGGSMSSGTVLAILRQDAKS